MDDIMSMDMSLSKLQEMVKDKEAWRAAVHGISQARILSLPLSHLGSPWMQRADSLEKTLMGKIEGRRRRGQQRMRWLDGITGHEFEQTPGDGEGQGSLE